MRPGLAVNSEALDERNKAGPFSVRPIIYIIVLILSIYGAYAYKSRADGIFACSADGYSSDRYLAFCLGAMYGEYDHGAFWFDLETEAQQSVTNAEVLFVGSSGMQAGFSTQATDDWFASAAVSYFLLGFSNGGNVQFIGPLLEKLNPMANVYIINVDRFFDTRVSRMAADVFHGENARERYIRKQRWQPVHRSICTLLPAICGNALALFRSRQNGSWIKIGSLEWHATFEVSDSPASNQDQWLNYAAQGERFISKLPVERDCILLTLVPSTATRKAEAIAIARALMLDLYMPNLVGLATYDRTHLDWPSRERWATAFFDAAGSRIRQCLDDSRRAQI